MLDELLKKKGFKTRIIKASKMVEANGRESSFAVANAEGKLIFGDVLSGECERSMPEKGIEKYLLPFFLRDIDVEVEGVAHFHPSDDHLIIPSGSDLQGLFWKTEDERIIEPSFKWMVIGMASSEIRLLCISPGQATEADANEWSSQAETMENFFFTEERQKEINRDLTEIGFRVEYRVI